MKNTLLKTFILFSLFTFVQYPLLADKRFGPYKGRILQVTEADTLYTEIEVWPGLFQRAFIRLKDLDAAEPVKIKGGRPVSACEKKAAAKAIKFVENFIGDNETVIISNISQIKSTTNYIFARISVGGNDLGEALINNKHAISVVGLKRKRWSCRSL